MRPCVRARPATMAETDGLNAKLMSLRHRLRSLGSVLVCYSGGVDSAFVLAVAREELGARAVGLTAVSPSLPDIEKEQAADLARAIGADHRFVPSNEMDDPDYVKNGPDRCFHCKSTLYRIAEEKKETWGLSAVVNGTNTDDLGDHRPGLEAARRAGVLSPLVECGFSKADVRAGARTVGLPVWDKPAAACLSSRIPYGTSVTRERLSQIGTFEAALGALGFRRVRVRHHETIARIELDLKDLVRAAAPEMAAEIVEAGKKSGYQYVTLDLGGYRMGSHNELLSGRSLRIV